jgi:tetratricopeptide (TPR) repeat protein
VQKPTAVAGARRAPGEIQQAYGNYLQAYARVKRALYLYEQRTGDIEIKINTAALLRTIAEAKAVILEGIAIYHKIAAAKRHALNLSLNAINYGLSFAEMLDLQIDQGIPDISGAGLTVNVDPSAIANATLAPGDIATQTSLLGSKLMIQNALVDDIGKGWGDAIKETVYMAAGYMSDMNAAYLPVFEAFYAQIAARDELASAWGGMLAAQAAYETVVAKAQRLLESRELERQQAVVALTKLRYHDMFFRQSRNESLARYSAAFDLAQKYVYLTAKAYDYETGLLATDPEAGDMFLREVISARAPGVFDADGIPIVGGGVGDPGLADIMARMDANWLVLKTRLGINNPQPYATWFSLRRELFRILPGPQGDGAWKAELAKYWVENLLTLPEYRRYCQPFQAVGGLQAKEPGLVIPFSSMIDFARNFFGHELAGEDSALDSTYFATKIAAAGLYFDGYNEKLNGYTGAAPFALTPTVYLIPVGDDRMRAPGLADGTALSYRIVDQVVPLPYTVGSAHLDDPDWMPLYDGYTGGVDLAARIRKYPSFRAYFGAGGPSADQLDCPRLVGRSAWNTRWLLIIPAGTLNANRDDALRTFINGKDANRDGTIDLSGVSDIRLGLKTYSHSGN